MRKVISYKNLPGRNPMWSGAVVYLLLDKFRASEWLFGALGLLWLIFIFLWIYELNRSVKVDLFSQDK